MISADAPGKVMLFGEYGVLEGGVSLLAAVNRRVQVTLTPAEKFTVQAPGWLAEEAAFELAGGRLIWQCAATLSERLAIVPVTLKVFNAIDPAKITLDTRMFFDGDNKLGLGSSAALCVALAGACSHYDGRALTLDDCQALHLAFQGSGSGADVAACYQGGVIEFRSAKPPVASALPADLQLVFVWTGLSASTGSMLQTLSDYRAKHPQDYDNIMAALRDAAESALGQKAQQVRAADWLAGVADFISALESFAMQTALPIFCSPHEELQALAKTQAVLYKPMGAGGGDLGLAASDDKDKLAGFCDQVTARGLKVLPLKVDPEGLRVMTSAGQ